MKRLILLIATITFLPFMASAQFEKGTLFLSGSSNFGANYYDFHEMDTKSLSIGLSPTIGTVLTPGLVGGISINPNYTWSKADHSIGEIKTKHFRASVTPFLRYYLSDGNKVKPFLEVSGGLGKSWSNGEIPIQGPDGALSISEFDNSENTLTARAGAGASIFLTEKIALDTSLLYVYDKSKPTEDSSNLPERSSSRISLSLGVSLFI